MADKGKTDHQSDPLGDYFRASLIDDGIKNYQVKHQGINFSNEDRQELEKGVRTFQRNFPDLKLTAALVGDTLIPAYIADRDNRANNINTTVDIAKHTVVPAMMGVDGIMNGRAGGAFANGAGGRLRGLGGPALGIGITGAIVAYDLSQGDTRGAKIEGTSGIVSILAAMGTGMLVCGGPETPVGWACAAAAAIAGTGTQIGTKSLMEKLIPERRSGMDAKPSAMPA